MDTDRHYKAASGCAFEMCKLAHAAFSLFVDTDCHYRTTFFSEADHTGCVLKSSSIEVPCRCVRREVRFVVLRHGEIFMDVMQASSRCIFPLSFDLLLHAVDLPVNFECGFPAPAITYGPDQLVLNPPA